MSLYLSGDNKAEVDRLCDAIEGAAMSEKAKYLKYLGILCIVLAIFAVAIMAVGYQPWSIGHVGTLVLLIVGAIVFRYLSKRTA